MDNITPKKPLQITFGHLWQRQAAFYGADVAIVTPKKHINREQMKENIVKKAPDTIRISIGQGQKSSYGKDVPVRGIVRVLHRKKQ